MNVASIDDWQGLAKSDPSGWRDLTSFNLAKCIKDTDTSVISGVVDCKLGLEGGALYGMPYALKDLFDLKGLPTHSSSVLPLLCDTMVECDSELVQKMRKLGASCVAKTQMNEFAYGLSGENPHYGHCPHPKMPDCLSGGSSSGSAYMVATEQVPVAFGTDTGGSIRLPSAWCGIYGIRWTPSYMVGDAFPLAPSFDTVGWFTQTAGDMRQMLLAWFGKTEFSAVSPLKGQVFLPEALLQPEVFGVLSEFAKRIKLPDLEEGNKLLEQLPDCQFAFNVLQSREAYAIHEKWLSEYGELYDPQVRARILRVVEWSDSDIVRANDIRTRIKGWFECYFESNDFLVMPICPGPSIPMVDMLPETREQTLQLTTPTSLAGLPALSVPVWLDSKRSVGLQFIFKDVDPQVPLGILNLCENI